MKVIDGAEVFTAEKNKVGNVDRVVLDPETKEVSHLVVRKGFLLSKNIVIPIDVIDHVSDDRVFLKRDIDDLENFPAFEETNYLMAEDLEEEEKDSTKYARPVFWYPTYGYGGFGNAPYAPIPLYYAETQRNIPENTVPLKEGAKVISADGKYVGNIEEVLVDPEADRATHIVIEKGLLFLDRKLIPTIWLTNVLEDEVHLAMKSSTLKKLPEYKG
jgi:uncharacterized protein YrrD